MLLLIPLLALAGTEITGVRSEGFDEVWGRRDFERMTRLLCNLLSSSSSNVFTGNGCCLGNVGRPKITNMQATNQDVKYEYAFQDKTGCNQSDCEDRKRTNRSRRTLTRSVRVSQHERLARGEIETGEDVLVQTASLISPKLFNNCIEVGRWQVRRLNTV